MKKKQAGFSVVELLLVLVMVALLVGLGYLFYQRRQKAATTTTTSTQSQTVAPTAGTTASIDSLTGQDASSESTIDQKHTSGEGTTAQSANSAAANVGGAYNESSL